MDSEVAETNVEYDLEVEVSSNASEQEDTSDDDEPEVAYTNEPLADENWRAQYEADRERNKNSTVLRSVQGLKKRTVPGFYDVLPQLRLASFERCVHKFPDFPKCLSSSGDKRKRRKLFWRNSLTNTK